MLSMMIFETTTCHCDVSAQRVMVKIQCIVVKNPDASRVEIENFCPCAEVRIRSAALLACFRLARAAAITFVHMRFHERMEPLLLSVINSLDHLD